MVKLLKNPLVLLVALILFGAGLRAPSMAAQEDRWSRGSVGTGLLLRRLDGVKRVLMIGAHPDDEDTSLLTALSRGMGVETAYLSLSRGEGGQNLIGPELDAGLGILRTGELLAARALDGGLQFFTRAFDFGYSKTAEETFRKWPREELVRDVTWVVRTFRPQVILSVFSGTSRDGHGHHQVAGIVAREAFEAAGDPDRFPEQLAAGAEVWSPRKLYRRTRGRPEGETATVETGTFDPLLGRSHFQVAMQSRSQHRSQDMGMPQPLGSRESRLTLVASRVSVEGPDELFAGVDTSFLSLAEGFDASVRPAVLELLREYREAVAAARDAASLAAPWQAAPALGEAREALAGALALGNAEGRGSPRVSGAETHVQGVLDRRMAILQEVILSASGVVVGATMEDDLLVPGEVVEGVVEVWNGGPFHLRSVHGTLVSRDGWTVEPTGEGPDGEMDLPPGALARWSYRLTVPDSAEPSAPYYLREPRDGEMYRWPRDASLWARAVNPPIVRARVELEVNGVGKAAVTPAAFYRGVDKARGEFVEPVLVVPALSVTLDPPVMAWPLGATEPRSFTVTVRSRQEAPSGGTAELVLPAGWVAEPASRSFAFSGAGEEVSLTFRVRVSGEPKEGSYTVEARVRDGQGRVFTEGLSMVDYLHVPRGLLVSEARSRISVFPVGVEGDPAVAYVMGSGDSGPEAIRQMGLDVDLLPPGAVRGGEFSGYDVVVLGIRAYETRPDLVAANERLLDFARDGGTVIVQYNKYEFADGNFAPHPVAMSRPHDRVTDETAEVRTLDPGHPVLTTPNAIGPGDFRGWVQERGLYFLSSWEGPYVPVLEMADPGEEPKEGGLVVAPLGEGVWVYTGIAFFRQFPEGVPGAYRLFANLLSLSGEDVAPGHGVFF